MPSPDRSAIVKAKCALYVAILDQPNEQLSDDDIEWGYRLASDKDIQAQLQKAFDHAK